MNRLAALTLTAFIAVGTVACGPSTAPHSQPVKQAEWQVPSSVATVELVPMDNIAPDKSYGTVQDVPPVTVPSVTETTVATPAYVTPVYAAPKPVTVQGTPVVVGTEAKPAPVKTQAPVTVPSAVAKPTPSATCPPLLHKGGVNITPPNAPSTCVYAQ